MNQSPFAQGLCLRTIWQLEHMTTWSHSIGDCKLEFSNVRRALEFKPRSEFFISSSEILIHVIDDHCLVQHGCASDPLTWLTFYHPASDFAHPEAGSHHTVFEVRSPYTHVTCRRPSAGLCKLSKISKPQKFPGPRWNCTEVDARLPIESLQFGPKTCPTSLSTGLGHNLRVNKQETLLESLGHNMEHNGTTCLVQGKVHNREQWVCSLGTESELLGILCQSPVAHIQRFFVNRLLFARGSLPAIRIKASSLICRFGHFGTSMFRFSWSRKAQLPKVAQLKSCVLGNPFKKQGHMNDPLYLQLVVSLVFGKIACGKLLCLHSWVAHHIKKWKKPKESLFFDTWLLFSLEDAAMPQHWLLERCAFCSHGRPYSCKSAKWVANREPNYSEI